MQNCRTKTAIEAEALQTAEMAKCQGQDILTELGQTGEALSDMRKVCEVLQYMQSLETGPPPESVISAVSIQIP